MRINKIVSFILNLHKKYFDNETFALDERMEDSRDYLAGGRQLDYTRLPRYFVMNDKHFQDQSLELKDRMSCTAQSVTNGANEVYTMKAHHEIKFN